MTPRVVNGLKFPENSVAVNLKKEYLANVSKFLEYSNSFPDSFENCGLGLK